MASFNVRRHPGPRKDLRGARYGKLVVLEWAGASHWKCACDCGRETFVLTANLNRKNTTSCGCIRNHMSSVRNTKHGLHGTRAYKIWNSVKRRCLDPRSASYAQYGARGITMWDEWANDPARFVADIGQPPSLNHTLDRIDNSRGYEPGNVRWATPVEQANNKTNNRRVTYRGKSYTISELAREVASECGILHEQFLSAFEKAIYGRNRK